MAVTFELVRGAVAERGVTLGHLKSGFFEIGKRAAVREQFGFERASARLGLGIIVGTA